MKKLFIAEKPNVSKQLKEIYDPYAKYTQVSKYSGYYEGKNYIFTAASGHLFRIKSPEELNPEYKKWDLNDLPLELPRNWPLSANTGNRYDSKIFPMIKKLTMRKDIDEIIVCTDPDREGQLIWGYIQEMLPPLKISVTRAWFKEWSPEIMRECVAQRKPNEDYKMLELAGRCRAVGDAIEGYNDTRAATCRFGGYRNVFSIGRVQTFTQHLIYQREKEILNFKPENYTVLKLVTNTDSKTSLTMNHKTDKKLSKTEAEKIKSEILLDPKVTLNVTKTRKKQNVKKLYSTTEIQKDMNRRYGFSANYTSDILQKLYSPEFALTTYPRTDVKEISKSNADLHARHAIENLVGCGLFDEEIKKVTDNNWNISPFVISKKDTLPHEAITPVFGSIDKNRLKSLNQDELKVYKAIVQRFLQAFYPKAEYDETVINTIKNEESFEARGKTIVSPGFMEIVGIEKNTVLPPVTNGKTYSVLDVIEEDKITSPPVRFTEASLLEAMENAGRFVDNKNEKDILKNTKGVGTGATRKEIIKKLYTRKYIESKGKTIYPTEKTMEMFKVLPDTPLTSASSTANMEIMLDEIQNGAITPDDYFDEVDKRTESFISSIKKINSAKVISQPDSKPIGNCPICGAPVIETAKGWQCSDWKNGCKFMIWKNVSGKTLTQKQATSLLENGTTGFINGFKPKDKNKKPFSAALEFCTKSDGTINFTKMQFNFEQKTDYICPNCGSTLFDKGSFFKCPDCNFILWKNVCHKQLNEADIKNLLDGKKTKLIKKFKSKAGKEFDAKLYLDKNDGYKMKFSFEKDSVTVCPKCGKPIMEHEKSYSCSGWRDGCNVTIWKNALSYRGIDEIKKSEAKRLLEGRVLKMPFISKKGKKYSGFVSYNLNTNKLEVDLEKRR